MSNVHNWEYNKEINQYWVSLICKRCGMCAWASSIEPHKPHNSYSTCDDDLVKKILNE